MSEIIEPMIPAARELLSALAAKNKTLVLAESCTGGLISGAITAIPGSSSALWGSFVTYSNQAKITMIGVDSDLITRWGAVSAPVALAMARGALNTSKADYVISVTGVAGPGGGSPEKPVGMVFCSWGTLENLEVREFCFSGDRHEVRTQTVLAVLIGLKKTLESQS